MKNLSIILIGFFLLSPHFVISQAVFTSKASNNWNSTATWTLTSGTDLDGIPDTDDDIILLNHIITVTANAACKNITLKGGTTGASKLTVNSNMKLTVSDLIYVAPNDAYSNSTTITGSSLDSGIIETNRLIIGTTSFAGLTNRSTTLFVENLKDFIINNNINIDSFADGLKGNSSRLRHSSGQITLKGQLIVSANASGYSSLGYRTENIASTPTNKGLIIFEHPDPIVSIATGTANPGQLTPEFTRGAVEYKSTATTPYTLQTSTYRSLMLNSNRVFSPQANVAKITVTESLQLLRGVFSGITFNGENKSVTLADNATIIVADGTFDTNPISSPKFIVVNSKYNVTYLQSSGGVKQAGLELKPLYSSGTGSNNRIEMLSIENTNGVNINEVIEVVNLNIKVNSTISGSGNLKVLKVLSVPTANITANFTDGLVTLVSGIIDTARVNELLENQNITGKVNVERSLVNASRRNWRLLTAPVKGNVFNSIYNNWQNNGVSGVGTSRGIEIWGPIGNMVVSGGVVISAGNGLRFISNSGYNMRKFNNATGIWSNIVNTTNEPLFNTNLNDSFLIFAPLQFLSGANNEGVYNSGSSYLVTSALGELITGDVTYSNILTDKFYLIGNPYASPVDFNAILSENGNEGIQKIWLLDPTLGEHGAYVTWDKYLNAYNNYNSFETDGTTLQSGQAFFVRAAETTSTLTIKEKHKNSNISQMSINKTKQNLNTTTISLFRVLLEKELSTGTYTNMDGCLAGFYDGGSNALDAKDGRKLSNPNETLAFYNTNVSLSIEHRASIQENDFLNMRLSQTVVGTKYKLKLYTEKFIYGGQAFLEDSFLNKTIEIPLDGNQFEYNFEITTAVESTGTRFKIVFKTTNALGNKNFMASSFDLYPNPVSKQSGISISLPTADDFDYKMYNLSGKLVQENLLFKVGTIGSIKFKNTISSGLYFIKLQNVSTKAITTKQLILN